MTFLHPGIVVLGLAAAGLALAGASARAALDRLSVNGAALREDLGRAAVQAERLQVAAALNLAADLFAKSTSKETRRELVVISDFQRGNWAAADFSILPE